MNDVKWTRDQQNAIDARESSLLVSAAAGSGKTAVLVERLVKRIVDERLDITQFLIITYTKAAASEIKKKISRALIDRIAQNPGDRHLRRQLALCGSARISTVHSFCSWVLKNYSENDSAISDFRILDEAEGKLILSETLSELIERKYEEKSDSFLALAKYMNDGRGDKLLFSSVFELLEKSRSHPYPEKWLFKAAQAYNTEGIGNIKETVWGREMFLRASETIRFCADTVSVLSADIETNAEASSLYHDSLFDARAEIEKCFSDDWDTLFENTQKFSLASLPSSKGFSDKTISKRLGDVFKTMREDMRNIPEKLLQADSKTLLSEVSALYPIVKELTSLAAELLIRFENEKKRRNALDYSDLEHLCIKLLIDDYDEERDIVFPSKVGRELSESFCEILLDEFQDSNIIQDIIFRSVSKNEKNIVMVGDVKQSIYGFRLADPSIFMKKYKNFKSFDTAGNGEPRCISLSQNFRSRSEILDTANGIFSRIMTERLGGVDYTREHYLIPRQDIPLRNDMQTEFCLIDYVQGEEKNGEAEARFTALKISELVESGFLISEKDGSLRPCRYSDFAILLRSASTSAPLYERELKNFNIPFIAPKAGGLLNKTEVMAIVSFLSVIDNPTSDIPLLATLKSPLFAFSADDLCEIRKKSEASIFSCMEKLSADDSATGRKCRKFLSLLCTLRTLSRGKSASELIWEIYNRTNALGMFGALPYGKERQKNLLEFYRSAEEFEALGYNGLYKFISHIAQLSENNGDIATARTYSSDAVTILTMHKSKGLEFPIVFVGSAIRSFNLEDIKAPILIHPDLGIGLNFKDSKTGVNCSTIMREAVRRRIMDEQKSEEMRLLYVALTRAREKMFITASRDNCAKKLSDVFSNNTYRELDAGNLSRRNDAFLWFLFPLLRTENGIDLFAYGDVQLSETEKIPGLSACVIPSSEIPHEPELEKGDMGKESTEASDFTFKEFLYPYSDATALPSKLTATKLSSVLPSPRVAWRKHFPRPKFIREKKLSPTERGTALHMAMQFADFSKCETEQGAANELLRLYEEKFLTKAEVEAVSPEHISAFLNSAIGLAMKQADKIQREFKFSVLLPASELLSGATSSDDEILLQGVIDLYFEKDGEVTIVDFKTDHHPPEGEVLEKYKAQLLAYQRALFEMTGNHAKNLFLYLVPHKKYIKL